MNGKDCKYICRLGLSMIQLKASMLEPKEEEEINFNHLEMRDSEKPGWPE